jgi:hypothetical protein
MALAPDNKLKACFEVMYQATLMARCLGWDGEREGLSVHKSKELATLMEAIHNIPYLVQNWEKCDEGRLRATLQAFDEKYRADQQWGMAAIYDRVCDGAPY